MQPKFVLSVVLVFCFCAAIYGNLSQDCGSETGRLISAVILECSNSSEECIFRRGTHFTVELTFMSYVNSNSLSVEALPLRDELLDEMQGTPSPYFYIEENHITHMFQLSSNICKDSPDQITCPIQAGQTYKYIAAVPIPNKAPLEGINLQWNLRSQYPLNHKKLVCAWTHFKIVAWKLEHRT